MFSDWWEEQIRLAVEKAKNGEYDGLCTCNCVDRRRFEEQAAKYNSLKAENERLKKQVDELTKQREVGREKLKNEIANKIFMSASHGAIQCGKMSVAIAEIEAEKYVEFAWEMVQQAVKDKAPLAIQRFINQLDIDEIIKVDSDLGKELLKEKEFILKRYYGVEVE